jgi:hypothetical protein
MSTSVTTLPQCPLSGMMPSETHSPSDKNREKSPSSHEDRLSFGCKDEFFHSMLSYRVRTEGPVDKEGNNLARLIYDACCPKEKEKAEQSSANLKQFSEALGLYGKWPKAFSNPSYPIRVFLDQVNLRMGVPWKGTGDKDSGGFLGALPQTLLLVPLFSATPVQFKITCLEASENKRYSVNGDINMKLKNGAELFSIQIDAKSSEETIRAHVCENVAPDGSSFSLSAVPSDEEASDFPSKFVFFSATNYLPSGGQGPRGSLAEMLTILQEPGPLTFMLERCTPEGHAILQIHELSDHIFFVGEEVFLQMSVTSSNEPVSFKLVQVIQQGSKAVEQHSKIKIDAGNFLDTFRSSSSPIPGSTTEIDRCDNVLMELMLCRALRTLFADKALHPCKLIMPVFVDDIAVLYPLMNRLSKKVSCITGAEVRSVLESHVLKRPLTPEQVDQCINISVRDVIAFYFDFQGLSLSDKSNRLKSMKEKAALVHTHIITTTAIELNNNSLFRYTSNNPLAHELLQFLEIHNILHLHPVLVKHDITSVKEFVLLSQSEIREIALEGHNLAMRPLTKEIVELSGAVIAAKSSKFALPVSQRLKLFVDKDSSFQTVIYSSQAIHLAIQKNLFSLWIPLIFFPVACGAVMIQYFQDPIVNLPFMIPNIATAIWMLLNLIFRGLESTESIYRSWVLGVFLVGAGFLIGNLLDKTEDMTISWTDSRICKSLYMISPQLHPQDYQSCVVYEYAYFGGNAVFMFGLVYCLLYRQRIFWRTLCSAFIMRVWVGTAYDRYRDNESYKASIVVCIAFPLTLIFTETLRIYGEFQALQIAKDDTESLSELWKSVLEKNSEAFRTLSEKLHKFAGTVMDDSSDMGEWAPDTTIKKSPPPIHQPIADFDELYNVATSINDSFQAWIESIFQPDVSSSAYLHFERNGMQNLQKHLSELETSLKGRVLRGPVKLPERAIAKVSQVIAFLFQILMSLLRFIAHIAATFL